MSAARQILGFVVVERWLFDITLGCVFYGTPTWGGEKGSPPPSPASSSTLTVGTSEEEGLHARPLPRILEVAFIVVSGDFGGGRIGTLPSSSHCRCVLLLTLTASTTEEEGQGFLLVLSVCSLCP